MHLPESLFLKYPALVMTHRWSVFATPYSQVHNWSAASLAVPGRPLTSMHLPESLFLMKPALLITHRWSVFETPNSQSHTGGRSRWPCRAGP